MNDKFVFPLHPEESDDFLQHARAVEEGKEDCIIKTKTRLTTWVILSFIPKRKKEENEKPKT